MPSASSNLSSAPSRSRERAWGCGSAKALSRSTTAAFTSAAFVLQMDAQPASASFYPNIPRRPCRGRRLLPATQPVAATEAALAEAKSVILCVDDEAIPLTLRKSVLEKSGFAVIPASSGAEALAIIETQPVDLVLTDLLMPGLSGTDLARQIKQRRPELPVVLYSGVNEIPDDAECADMFLSKVEGPARMCEKIGNMLKSSRA